MEAGQDGQAEEPEPEEEINLLVDNVEGEDAETVELLLAGRGAHGVEGAAVPESGMEWEEEYLVTVGKTVHMGLGRSLLVVWSWLRYLTTWVPYLGTRHTGGKLSRVTS